MYAELLTVGLVSGFFIGIVGIGAGVIVIPLLVGLGFSIKEAVAAGLFMQLLPQSLPALYMYHKANHLRLIESFILLFGSTIGMIIGAMQSTRNMFSERILYIILFILMMISTIYIFFRHVWI